MCSLYFADKFDAQAHLHPETAFHAAKAMAHESRVANRTPNVTSQQQHGACEPIANVQEPCRFA